MQNVVCTWCSQVNKDCDFLEQERIMDYSLLVGISFHEFNREAADGRAHWSPSLFNTRRMPTCTTYWAEVELFWVSRFRESRTW